MKLVKLSTNTYSEETHFIVDDEDFERVSQYKWRVSASRNRKKPHYSIKRKARKAEKELGSPQDIIVSRFIMGVHLKYASFDNEVDHINRNTFDNRKSNLRVCSRYVNQRNKDNNTAKGFGLWGATYNKAYKTKPWQANFHIKGKTYMAGRFDTELEAHEAAKAKFKEITGVSK